MTSPADQPESNLIPETPTATEATWLAFTIAFAVFALIAVVLAFVYVFDLLPADMAKNSAADKASRAAAVTPFLAACAAAVTFCAVMWRGAINSRQADEQRRQNDSTDEAELALLLDKAAGILKSGEPEDTRLALAMLSTIALAPNNKYATFAIDLVIDMIKKAYPTKNRPDTRLILQIANLLATAKNKLNRIGTPGSTLHFGRADRPPFEARHIVASLLEVLPPCKITGLTLGLTAKTIDLIETRRGEITFDSCVLIGQQLPMLDSNRKNWDQNWDLRVDNTYNDCIFVHCLVREVTDVWLNRWTFTKCDFSGAVFVGEDVLESVTFEECWYDADNPPYVIISNYGEEHYFPLDSVSKLKNEFELTPRRTSEYEEMPLDD